MSVSLAIQINTTDVTITVNGQITDASGPGVLVIDTEQIAYSGNSVNQFFGLTRGFNGTTPAAHYIGAPITYMDDADGGSLSFTDVAADIGSVYNATPESTIFIPQESGMYLLSFYGVATVDGSETAPNLYMAWTDEVGLAKNFTFAGNLDPVHTDGPNQITIPIYATAGTPVWMATSSGGYVTTRWSFYFKVTPA